MSVGVALPAQIQEYKDKGYIETHREIVGEFEWAWFINPEDTCAHPLRTGPCCLDKGHRGRHAGHTQVFFCDACGKTRRGHPAVSNDEVSICFMCQEVRP